jgi:hypothetical protein
MKNKWLFKLIKNVFRSLFKKINSSLVTCYQWFKVNSANSPRHISEMVLLMFGNCFGVDKCPQYFNSTHAKRHGRNSSGSIGVRCDAL